MLRGEFREKLQYSEVNANRSVECESDRRSPAVSLKSNLARESADGDARDGILMAIYSNCSPYPVVTSLWK